MESRTGRLLSSYHEAPSRVRPWEGKMQTLLNISQAAAQLGISKRFLYVLVERREISCYRPGRRILFSEQQLEEFLKKSLQPAEDGV